MKSTQTISIDADVLKLAKQFLLGRLSSICEEAIRKELVKGGNLYETKRKK